MDSISHDRRAVRSTTSKSQRKRKKNTEVCNKKSKQHGISLTHYLWVIQSSDEKGISSVFSGVTNAIGGLFGIGRKAASAVGSVASIAGRGLSWMSSPITWISGGVASVSLVLLLRK